MQLMSHERPITQRHRKADRTDPNSVAQRAKAAGMVPATVAARVKRGMSLEEALAAPPMPQKESASLAGKASRAAARQRRADRKAMEDPS